MAGKRTVDIRLAFEQFDMMPGAGGKKFQRNLLLNGGSADTQGFSITDCFLRIDDYAVQNGQPITMPPPAGVHDPQHLDGVGDRVDGDNHISDDLDEPELDCHILQVTC